MSRYDKHLKNQLIFMLGKNIQTLSFIEELSEVGDLLFFGGSIRDICIFPNNPPSPRDFDIAIKFKNKEKFESIKNNYEYRKNRFGGYKFKISNVEFDIWNIENTWAFNHTDLKVSEENLAKSVYLNIDGIVFNFNKSIVYDESFDDSIKHSKIDIILEDNPQVELNLLRALVFKEKYKEELNLSFSNRLKNIFRKYLEDREFDFIDYLYEIQSSHYKNEYFSKEDIKSELQHISF